MKGGSGISRLRPGLTPVEAALLEMCDRVEEQEQRLKAQLRLIRNLEARVELLEWQKRSSRMNRRRS